MKMTYTKDLTKLSTLLVVVAPSPSIHYSAEGKVLVFEAIGLMRLKFFIWANGVDDPRIDDFLALPDDAAVEVSGVAYVEPYKDKSGISQRRNLFVVNYWKKGW
jgi:hypothetical protein